MSGFTPIGGDQEPVLPYINAQQSQDDASGVWLANSVFFSKPRLKNVPTAQDNLLSPDNKEQVFTDCRTIEGWMSVVKRLINAAWSDENGKSPVLFTHDYALLPEDPQDLKGVIIVWSIVSMVPATYRNRNGGDYQEKKPKVREVIYPDATAITSTPNGNRAVAQPIKNGVKWVWAQSMDVVMQFTVFADSYDRKFEYVTKLLDLLLTYTGVFIQTGLQQCFFRSLLTEALYDPPHTEEFPNQSILYDVRIERQTPATYAAIEEVLIQAGIVNSINDDVNDGLVEVVTGVAQSPILPNNSITNNPIPLYTPPQPVDQLDWPLNETE